MLRDNWSAGDKAHFEYHCWESPDSSDAELWYRSHRIVTVLGNAPSEPWEGTTLAERAEDGCPRNYLVRFADGHEGTTVFEDELSTSSADWYRPDPPTRLRRERQT